MDKDENDDDNDNDPCAFIPVTAVTPVLSSILASALSKRVDTWQRLDKTRIQLPAGRVRLVYPSLQQRRPVPRENVTTTHLTSHRPFSDQSIHPFNLDLLIPDAVVPRSRTGTVSEGKRVASGIMAEERVFDPVLDPVPADLTNNHKNFGDLPARPFWSDEARWIPKLATVGCLGLTYWRARQNMGLKGTSALAFPLFGTDAKERLFALYMAGNLTSPLMIWTLEQLGAKKTNEAWRIQQALNL